MSHSIRLLREQDVPFALELCRAAGWNQLSDDWIRILRYEPAGCFAAEIDGVLVGTVTTTTYGTDLGWIGMMLVDEDHRRCGIATDLMRVSIDYLRDRNVQCIKLDATPAGAKVYERLGFQPELTFQRFALPTPEETMPLTIQSRATLEPPHFQLDRLAFGVDRSGWLQRLNASSAAATSNKGFSMLREGYLADYMGPVVATESKHARELISRVLESSVAKQVFWDVLHPDAASIAHSMGFQPVRELTRMRLGDPIGPLKLDMQFAICDPATG